MSTNYAHFKPKFDLHTLCHICRSCNCHHTCHICQAWPEIYWLHIKRLEDKSKANKIKKFKAFLASKMSSPTSDSDGCQSSTPSRSSKSSQGSRKTVVRSQKAGKLVDPTVQATDSSADTSQSSIEAVNHC